MAKTETKHAQGQATEQQANRQHSGQRSGAIQSAAQTRGQGDGERGMARPVPNLPSLFSLSPIDFFATSPFELMRRFSEEMGRAFQDYGMSTSTRSQGSGTGRLAIFSPPIEVFERDGNFVVRAEMPGANTDDVTVVISDDRIVIRGEIRNEHEEQGEGLYRCERTHGEFYRVIPLPEGADTEQAQADINNGILEISVPVSEGRQRQREIPIRTEGREQARAASAQRK